MNESPLPSLSLKKDSPSLHEAVQKNNLKDIKAICESDPLIINDLNSEGYSALYLAVKQGHPSAAALILSYDPIISQEGPLRKTALHEAARRGDNVIIAMLIKKMNIQSLNLLSGEAFSALCYACLNGHSKTAEILINAGAEVTLECEDQTWNPLNVAIFYGHIETAKIICQRFPQAINLLTEKNFSTVSIALGLEDVNKAKALLQILIQNNVNKSLFSTPQAIKSLHKFLEKDPSLWKPYGEYAIRGAILKKDIKIIEFLIKGCTKLSRRSFLSAEIIDLATAYKIDILDILKQYLMKNSFQRLHSKGILDSEKEFQSLFWETQLEPIYIKDFHEVISLVLAAESQDLDTFKALIAEGADIKKQIQGFTFLNWAILFTKNPKTIQFLLDHGGELNPKDPNVFPILNTAIKKKEFKLIKTLIEYGANIHYTDPNGWTFLMIAAQNGSSKIVDFLIKKGINVNKKSEKGSSALSIAAEYGNTECMKILIYNGAEINPKESRVIPPLFFAMKTDQKNAVEMLIDCGANVDQKIKNGWTFLMFAADNGQFALVRVLLEKGCDINQKSPDGQTALMMAKNKNHIDIVKALESHLKK
jgi:ankyrin repeat protein